MFIDKYLNLGDLRGMDFNSMHFFYLTNLGFFYLFLEENNIINKLTVLMIFIISSTFHLSQIIRSDNINDSRTKMFRNLDICCVFITSIIIIINNYKNLNNLNVGLILIGSIFLFSDLYDNKNDNGYRYMFSHGMWHIFTCLSLYCLFKKKKISDLYKSNNINTKKNVKK